MDDKYATNGVMATGANPPRIVDLSSGQSAPDGAVLRGINNATVVDDMPERAKLVADIASKLDEYGKQAITRELLKDK